MLSKESGQQVLKQLKNQADIWNRKIEEQELTLQEGKDLILFTDSSGKGLRMDSSSEE